MLTTTCAQVTASQLINFSVMSYTYIRFRKACKAQQLSRDALPHKGFWQPYVLLSLCSANANKLTLLRHRFTAYYALTGTFIMTFVSGYTVFLPGNWSIPTFLFSYTMIGVFPLIYLVWKLLKRTRFLHPLQVDLVKDVAEIDEYTRNYVPKPPRNKFVGWFDRFFG